MLIAGAKNIRTRSSFINIYKSWPRDSVDLYQNNFKLRMSRVSRKSENQPIPNDDLMSRESSTREDQNVEEKISTSDQNLDGAVEVDNEIGADEPEVIIVEPEEEKEPEQPYEPPPFNFIKVEFGGT